MRITRSAKLAAGLAATLAIFTATLPSTAASTDPVAIAAQPVAGSSNVRIEGSRIILGDAPATIGSTELKQRSGLAELNPVRFPAATSAVVVGYTSGTPDGSSAEVDVRAWVKDRWSEWTSTKAGTPTTLTGASDQVQLRIIVTAPPTGANPWVGDVTVQPTDKVDSSRMTVQAAPLQSRVFATREGLVGGTTANGHVIISRDHFVALPSRRGLAGNGSGTYSVKVCTASRCAFEPVWDVGPWNTKDDYWNPSATREMWKDLPQGRPEAQAAYQNGYNGGKDQFGRTVANPAGIDLADGVFWDAVGMSNNGFVDVTYLWTGDGGRGTVAITSGYLNVRNSPNSSGAVVGMAGKSAQVTVECQTTGSSVTGSQGTSNVWLRVHNGMYVAKAYISAGTFGAC
ncbi:SH3 domain-containing protein [Kribbella pittospori]|uniref:SH3 domain-containing protein n=1 Tax=Kribbella pittospori TaxID=722689 RepID=A0A4R0K259_9ACTN|nr:SH3 domain-containing protein [Kribbella pittospori]TCC51866.1 SH3 domain-containing protein [Kribbella pittospori]